VYTVTLTLTTDYTVNTTTGVVTLVNEPDGAVTADVDGYKDGGTWLESTEDIADYLAGQYINCGTFDTPTDRIGYFHSERERIADILDKLALGCGAFWFIDDSDCLRFKLWDVPGTPDATYDQTQMLNYSFEMNDGIYDTQEIRYNRNWTLQSESRAGATAAHAEFIATRGDTTSQIDYGDGSDATDAPLIESYFESQTPADTVATRIVGLTSSARFRYTTTVPLMVTYELGDTITIESNDGNIDGFIMGRELQFDGGVPMQQLEILV
jgi:hypothetical protein